MRLIDEKCGQLVDEVAEERAVRGQTLTSIEGEVHDLEDDISEQIEAERLRAQECDRELLGRLEEDLGRFKKEINEQTDSREACESEIYELMKNVVLKIKEEIELEKQSRETAQEHLLSLLEDTCQRIETMANST